MLRTKVDVIEEHHFFSSEEPLLSVSAVVAVAPDAVSGSGVKAQAAVNGLTVSRLHDIMLAGVLGPPKGLQYLVSNPCKKAYAILCLLTSAST